MVEIGPLGFELNFCHWFELLTLRQHILACADIFRQGSLRISISIATKI